MIILIYLFIYLLFIYFFNVVILTEYAYTLIWYYMHFIIGHTHI